MCGQIQALQKVPVPEGPEEGTGDSRTEHHNPYLNTASSRFMLAKQETAQTAMMAEGRRNEG